MTPAGVRTLPDLSTEGRLTGAFLLVAILALFGGIVTGVAQALEHAGIDVYPWLTPFITSYYHGLTVHGVLNVLVWTTFFIAGFLPFLTVRALGRPLASRALGWATFWLMTGGLLLAAVPLLGNAASVMCSIRYWAMRRWPGESRGRSNSVRRWAVGDTSGSWPAFPEVIADACARACCGDRTGAPPSSPTRVQHSPPAAVTRPLTGAHRNAPPGISAPPGGTRRHSEPETP